MRTAVFLALLVGLLAASSRAADRRPIPELMRLLGDELGNFETRTKDMRDWENQIVADNLWQELCRRGTSEDADAAAKLYLDFPVSWRGRTACFVGVSELWIAREIEAIAAEHRKPPVFVPTNEAPPDRLKGAPAELLAAWRDFHNATRAGAKSYRPWQEGKDIESHRAEFFGMLDDFLLRGRPELVEKIGAFSRVGGKSGMQTEWNLREVQRRVTFMDALRRRRLDEAVGLAFTLEDRGGMMPPEREGHISRLLLTACGLDWERIFIGAIAESGGRRNYKREGWLVENERLMNEIIVHGSPGALRLLVMHEKLDPGAGWRSLYSLIEASPGGTKVPLDYPASRAKAAPKDVQAELLALAPKWIALSDDPDFLLNMLGLLRPLRRRELAESWQGLMGHAADRVSSAAREALLSIGIEPRKPETVKLKITLNGAPVANTQLSLELVAPDQYQRERSLYPYGRLTLTTDRDGHTELRKASLISAKQRPTALLLFAPAETRMRPEYQAVGSYWTRERWRSEVKVHGWAERVPVPADLSSSITVSIETRDCVFHVAAGAEHMRGPKAVVWLKRRDGISPPGVFKVDAGERIIIPGIQAAEYDAVMWIPGTAEWRGGPFKLGKDTPPVATKLDAGADVSISVMPPGVHGGTSEFRIIREGAPKDWYPESECRGEITTYRGLPVGKYVIHIPSSSKLGTRHAEADAPQTFLPYAAREIPFEITAKSPPRMDLGTIKLEAMR